MESTNTFEEELVLEILKLVQKEFSSVNEIVRLTKELGDASARDDRVTMQMLLEMRKNEMDMVDGYEKNIGLLVENSPADIQPRLRSALIGKEDKSSELKGIQQIESIVRSRKKAIEQAITIDKVISMRLAGKESFYAAD